VNLFNLVESVLLVMWRKGQPAFNQWDMLCAIAARLVSFAFDAGAVEAGRVTGGF
jgi:hypothetical protein